MLYFLGDCQSRRFLRPAPPRKAMTSLLEIRHWFESTRPELSASTLTAEPAETDPCLPCRDIGRCSKQAVRRSRKALQGGCAPLPQDLLPPCIIILLSFVLFLVAGAKSTLDSLVESVISRCLKMHDWAPTPAARVFDLPRPLACHRPRKLSSVFTASLSSTRRTNPRWIFQKWFKKRAAENRQFRFLRSFISFSSMRPGVGLPPAAGKRWLPLVRRGPLAPCDRTA